MGTDIRIYAEQHVNGRWQFIGEMTKNMYYEYEYEPEHENEYHPEDLYDIRIYSLFAILADVRNDEGMELLDTFSHFLPCYSCRGGKSEGAMTLRTERACLARV